MSDPSIITSEAEAWAVLAETIRGAGGVWFDGYRAGLCKALDDLASSLVVLPFLVEEMYLRAALYRPSRTRSGWWWPLEDTASRVRFCRRMARLAAKEGA